MPNFVSGKGSPEPNLMIIGEAPGKTENETGEPFVGAAGQLLDRTIKGLGFPNWRADCYVTNVVKYQPIDNDFDRLHESGIFLQREIDFLMEEIRTLNPNMILFLGKNVHKALNLPRTLDEYRGSIFPVFGRKGICTYHPARFLYAREAGEHSWKPYEKAVFTNDILRAFQECNSKELNLPRRSIHVVENSNQFIQYLNRYEGRMQKCGRDIESINNIPFCEAFSFHPNEGISIPLFDKPLGKTRSKADVARLWLMIDKIDRDPRIKHIWQNGKYDIPKRKKLGFTGPIHSDIMLKASVVCLEFPKNLAFQTSIHTREPFYKNEYEAFKEGKTSIQDYMFYNAKDGCVTREIDDVYDKDLEELGLTEFFYEFVMPLHHLYEIMEANGICYDEKVRQELIQDWCVKQAKLEIELFKIGGMHLNVNSWKQVQLFNFERLKLPWRKGTGESVLVALMANHAKKDYQRRALELILETRRVRRLLSTTLATPADFDGKMRTSVFIPATETRRTADDILSPPIRPYNMGIGFKTLSKHGEAGIIRKMFVPRNGYVFINFDQSQAEARVCSLLADDEETLKNFDTIDIHALTASWIFGGNEAKWSKATLGYECPERFCGKTLRHAGHLDMQKRTAMDTINTDAKKAGIELVVSEWKSGEFLKVFHNHTPKIRGVFHEGIREALLRDDMFLTGTSPCVGKNWFPKRQFYGDWDRDLWKEGYSFIPQQTVSDKTKWILLQLLEKHPWIIQLGESHDAGLVEVPTQNVDDAYWIIKEIGEQPISFEKCSIPRRDLVIPIDVEIGRENYKDLKKYKPISARVGGMK
jgi:uracil-DNA glycosylase family 4